MVLTRSQMTKEENDIKLAEQQSLAEQVQQASVSQEGQHELETTSFTSQNVSQEDVSQDTFQASVVKPKVSESDFSKQIAAEADSFKQDSSGTKHSEQDAFTQEVAQHATVQHRESVQYGGQQIGVEKVTKLNSGHSSSNAIIVGSSGDQHPGDQYPGHQYSGGGNHDDGRLNDGHVNDEDSDDEQPDNKNSNAEHLGIKHSDTGHSNAEHLKDERLGDGHLVDEHPGYEHSDEKHTNDEHSDAGYSDNEYLSDELPDDGEHSVSDDEQPDDEQPDDEHSNDEDMTSVEPMHTTTKVIANESNTITIEHKDTKSFNNVTTLSEDILTVTSGAEYSQRYSLRTRVKNTERSVLTKVEEFITTLNITESHKTPKSNGDDDVDTSGNDHDQKVADLSAPDARTEEHDGNFQPTTTRHGKKTANLKSKKAPVNNTGLWQKSAVSALASKKVASVAGRPGRGGSDNVRASIPDSKRSVRARGRTAPKGRGKQYDSAENNTQGKKQSTTFIGDQDIDLDIPINPEDEDEFVPEERIAITTQTSRSLRARTKLSNYREEVRVIARSRTTKPLKASQSTKSRAANVVKARQSDTQEKHWIVKLSLRKKLVTTLEVKKLKPKPVKVKVSNGFFTNKYRFKFGWTPFAEYPKVQKQTFQEVYNLLAESLAPEGISLERKSGDEIIINGVSQGPMHAGEAVTVDALVKVIMSQATNNENALSAQARLISAFPYLVKGETVTGKTPNYHEVRLKDNEKKVQNALAPAGLHVKRAVAIQACLNAIRQKNIDANSPGCGIDSNPPDATDFVPGALSLKYLEELSMEGMMNELLSLPLIGTKTAMCILAFAYGLPVFAVDTHVHRMVKWLGWVPDGCHPNDAAAHLDLCIPNELKYGLHQGFWHHGQKCLRCMAKNDPSTKGWEDAVCVLEEYVKRHPKKERKSPEQKRKKESDDGVDADSPKPKRQKGNKTGPPHGMTDEEKIADGWVKVEVKRDDNFGTPGANTWMKEEWVKLAI